MGTSLAGHVARIVTTYKISIAKLEGINHMGSISIDERITLKYRSRCEG
jgi:hypothetical protein